MISASPRRLLLNRPDFIATASKAANTVLTTLSDTATGRLKRTYVLAEGKVPAYLEHAFWFCLRLVRINL